MGYGKGELAHALSGNYGEKGVNGVVKGRLTGEIPGREEKF